MLTPVCSAWNVARALYRKRSFAVAAIAGCTSMLTTGEPGDPAVAMFVIVGAPSLVYIVTTADICPDATFTIHTSYARDACSPISTTSVSASAPGPPEFVVGPSAQSPSPAGEYCTLKFVFSRAAK